MQVAFISMHIRRSCIRDCPKNAQQLAVGGADFELAQKKR
jgi:hypothetical protein